MSQQKKLRILQYNVHKFREKMMIALLHEEKNKELWHLGSSRTLAIRRKFQSILSGNCRLHTEEQRRQNLFLHKQEDWQQHLTLNMALQECRHDHATNTSRRYTGDAGNHTRSRGIQFTTQRSRGHSWKRKSSRHRRSATHAGGMRSRRRLQPAPLHMGRNILLETTFIIEWSNRNDHKQRNIADATSRHNYERLSRISNDDRSSLHDRRHHK